MLVRVCAGTPTIGRDISLLRFFPCPLFEEEGECDEDVAKVLVRLLPGAY